MYTVLQWLQKCVTRLQNNLLSLTHPFNGPFSGITQVSQYQKGKTNLDFTEARDSEWQWHQLGHVQVSTSLQTDNHASTPLLSFLQAGCPSCRPTNSVKALKANQSTEGYHCVVYFRSVPWYGYHWHRIPGTLCWWHALTVHVHQHDSCHCWDTVAFYLIIYSLGSLVHVCFLLGCIKISVQSVLFWHYAVSWGVSSHNLVLCWFTILCQFWCQTKHVWWSRCRWLFRVCFDLAFWRCHCFVWTFTCDQ